ncbi:MAG TPA: bifunctional serine/threonine-protein kinase/formylglycine-generating enzyme family protein [Myxococcota bacterium]|nr:bifunctional serine/threonine-protein kinase/formylglycine-generating enzyme family protein [Myxococcota bacterium]
MPDYCLHCCLEHSRCTCDAYTKAQPVNNDAFCLPAGTLLDGKYRIGRVLGAGGFGITYLAADERLGFRVAIKEYMPRSDAVRDTNGYSVRAGTFDDQKLFQFGLSKFLEEARVLARITEKDNPRIVGVYNFFEENGTAYLVMRYLEGQTLSGLLQSRGGRLPENEAIVILSAMLDGLREVHNEGLIHRDIKPQNVFITNDGGIKLIDFGAARYAQGVKSRGLTQVLTAPYAPFEQYSQKGNQGPWTDIYAVGVTFYQMLTGLLPDDALSRVTDPSPLLVHAASKGTVSKALDDVVAKATCTDVSGRFRNVDEFHKALSLPSSVNLGYQEPSPKQAARVSPPRVTKSPARVVPKSSSRDAYQGSPPVRPPREPVDMSADIPSRSKGSKNPGVYIFVALIVVVLGVVAYQVVMPELAREFWHEDEAWHEPASGWEAPASAGGGSDLEWVRIPGGSFSMGSNDGDPDDDEQPVHRVTVPTFEMSKTQVTVDQYMACVDAGACTAPDTGDYCNWGPSGRGKHPINCVDWHQAQAYAKWAGGRLPSEAEWEYAARSGGRDWKYPWGNEDATCERAVMWESGTGNGCGRGSTWPVCSKPRGNTTHGLCDMAGNVWEWVQDWYHDSYNGAPTDGSAWESPTGSSRVVRGGSWFNFAGRVRAAYRGNGDPGIRYVNLGLRLARSVR